MRTIVLAALIPLAACGTSFGKDSGGGIAATGSGDARTYAVADFTGVELSGPDDVDVRVGAGFSVRAEGDAKVLDRLKIEKVGNSLKVGRVRSAGFQWGSGKGAKIYVTMPRIMADTQFFYPADLGARSVKVSAMFGFGSEGQASDTYTTGQIK